jgi:hypothetical protein
VSYLGDEGGIVCHIQPEEDADNVIIISLTHVRVPGIFLFFPKILSGRGIGVAHAGCCRRFQNHSPRVGVGSVCPATP